MARHCIAARRNEHGPAAPTAHAGLGKFRVVIGNDVFDFDFAAQAFFGLPEKFQGLHKLFARGKELLTVGERPSVILHVCEFDAGGGRIFRDRKHLVELTKIVAMQNKIEGDGDAAGLEPAEHFEFLRVGFGAGDFVGGFFASALKTELEVVKAGSDEFVQAFFIEREAGSDEVDIESSGPRSLDEFIEVGSGERFASGEVELHDAGGSGLGKNARPYLGGKLFAPSGEFAWVRAVDAVERTAVSEFGDEGERSGHRSKL